MNGLLLMENNDSTKLCCCMICFVFIFIILVIAICWTNYESFENFTNIIKYNHETMQNIFQGGFHYLSLNPNDNILEKLRELTKQNKTALWVITAPWCGYCKKLKNSGELTKIAKKYPVLTIEDKHPQAKELMHIMQAEGFPALGIFSQGKMYPYKSNSRQAEHIIKIMDDLSQEQQPTRKPTGQPTGQIIQVPPSVKPDMVRQKIKNFASNGYNKICTVYLAPWCGYCKKLKEQKILEGLANRGVIIFEMDDNHEMTKEQNVRGFPTIRCWKGSRSYPYEGERSVDGILRFMDEL